MASKPDLVVAIDFGMTCTGVAYCDVASGADTIRYIQKWPGRSKANENKVPTLLVYPRGLSTPSSWGFLAETVREKGTDDDVQEWFKIWLDEQFLEHTRKNAPNGDKLPSIRQVEAWYTDYLQCVYDWIKSQLKSEVPGEWDMARIEFVFSVPTTWNTGTVERFKNIMTRAGFGVRPGHSAFIGLTEAEAAAVHTARSTPALFKEGQILLVCDAGGGTTDLAVFRIKENGGSNGLYKLEQIDTVFGMTVGSILLDDDFEKTVLHRLEKANDDMPMGIDCLDLIAADMRASTEFQNAKCDYGTEESFYDTEVFSVPISKLDLSYSHEQYAIRDGQMFFQREDLKPFFGKQVGKLFELIDKQLERLQTKMPNEQVAHIVLSGGLGNSAYVRDQLRLRYLNGKASQPNTRNLSIRVAPEPQLVVCKGNVADRIQKLKSGQPVLGLRCCRSSYGMLCKVKYNPSNPAHQGLPRQMDPVDNIIYVTNWINWFIKQGEPVSSDFPIIHEFFRKCLPATPMLTNPPRVFSSDIVYSDVDPGKLPNVLNSSCRKACKVYTDFSKVPLKNFKLKNRHWWNTGKMYHRINFEVKTVIGPADITFELWHQGVKLGKDKAIKVEWMAAPLSAAQLKQVPGDFAISSRRTSRP